MFTPQHSSRMPSWLRFSAFSRRKKIIISIATILVLCGGGVSAWWIFFRKETPMPAVSKPAITTEKPTPTPEKKPVSPLTGNEITTEQAQRPVTAIMIENSPDARPQSGLNQAGVVFEAVAEGGITRFLALYQESAPGLVGPVRSLRPYYVDWLAAFNASVAHVGGSAKALSEVRNGSYRDIDQFFNAGSYWRASDRYAPHNVYTNFEKLDALNASKGYKHSEFTGFARKADEPSSAPNATAIQVNISGALYNSTYAYEKDSNSYVRSQGGEPHLDREEGQIKPKVVVVLKMKEITVMEDGYRQSLESVGSGEAWIFQDGVVTHANWHKPTRSAQITFTNDAGAAVKLNAGRTWLTAIPLERTVTWQ